jgi:hypothetical protein
MPITNFRRNPAMQVIHDLFSACKTLMTADQLMKLVTFFLKNLHDPFVPSTMSFVTGRLVTSLMEAIPLHIKEGRSKLAWQLHLG